MTVIFHFLPVDLICDINRFPNTKFWSFLVEKTGENRTMGREVVIQRHKSKKFCGVKISVSGVSSFSLTSKIRNTLMSCIVTLSAQNELKKCNAYLTLSPHQSQSLRLCWRAVKLNVS